MQDLEFTIYIDATPNQVWETLTSPTKTRTIYGGELQSTFEVGAPYQYVGRDPEGHETVHVYGEVLAFEPCKQFTHTQKIGEIYGEAFKGYSSRIAYLLESIGRVTQLKVIHDNWMQDDPSYPNTDQDWYRLLSNIKTAVETGHTLDFG